MTDSPVAHNFASRSLLYAGGAILLWSTVSTAFKLSLHYLRPLELLTWASLASLLVLVLICIATRQSFRPRSWRDVLMSIGLGLLNPFLYYNLLFEAYDRLRAQEAQTLNYTWAIVLVLLSAPLLKQRLHLRDLVAVLLGFAGALIIALQGDFRNFRPDNPLGVGLALGSSIVWALYWIYNLRDTREALPKLTLNFVFGFVFSLILLVARGMLRVPSWQGMLGAGYVGLFEMGITFVLWLQALHYSGNTARVSVFIYLTPFLSLVFIHFILGETITRATVVGLVFIVAGILGRQFQTTEKS